MKTKEFSARDVMIELTIDCSDRQSQHIRLPSPDEGRELLQAFMTIADPTLRRAVIAFVQHFARRASGLPEDVAETLRRRSFLC